MKSYHPTLGKGDFDQHLERSAPRCWSKYTTGHNTGHETGLNRSCFFQMSHTSSSEMQLVHLHIQS